MDTVAKEPRALARGRTSGVRALGYLGLFQVTRRQGGTLGGRYRSNGYAPTKNSNQTPNVNPFAGKGSAVLYRTCLRAKLERILATPGTLVRKSIMKRSSD